MSYSQMAQLELMNAMNNISSEAELNEFKNLLAHYFAQKAQKAIDALWDKGVINEQTIEQWGAEHMRTPYSMRRIVLDTNCLLQALPSHSPYHQIWTEVLTGNVCLCVNTEILNEYEEILSARTTPEIAHNVVEAIARLHTTVFQEVYIHFGLIEADADDNKFVDCAVAADAEYIVSNDSHFNVLKQVGWPKLTVIAIKEFLMQLNSDRQ